MLQNHLNPAEEVHPLFVVLSFAHHNLAGGDLSLDRLLQFEQVLMHTGQWGQTPTAVDRLGQ